VTRSARVQGSTRSEAGDTLIEVLVAVVILAFCVVGLLGALTTSITSSSEHRSLASDDTVLRSFAEAAKYDIQFSPGYLYQNCATTYATNPVTAYRIVNVYPSAGSVGTPLTVFGTDFTASSSVSVIFAPFAPVSGISSTTLTTALTKGQTGVSSLGVRALTVAITSGELVTIGSGSSMQTVTTTAAAGVGATSITVSSFTSTYAQLTGSPVSGYRSAATISNAAAVRNDGTVSATVTVPTVTAGSYSVLLWDGSYSASSVTNFAVPTVASTVVPGAAVSGIHVGISNIQWWNSSSLAWDLSTGTCAPNDQSGIQQITLMAIDVNGVADTLSLVVTNPVHAPPHPAPTFAVTSSPSNPVYLQTTTLTFSATLTGSNPNPNPVPPTGTITWFLTLNGASVSPSCSSLAPQSGTNYSTATCTVSSPQAGVYQLTGNYAGDGNYSPTAGYGTATVVSPTPTVAVNISPSSPTPGQTLTFSATVTGPSGGPTPTGSVQWAFTSAPNPAPTCNPSSLSGSGNSATTTVATDCVVANSQAGTYQVTATYSGDSNYQSATGSGSVTVAYPPMVVTTITSTNAAGNTAGKAAKGDTIVITFSQPLSASTISSLGSTGTLTLCDQTSCGITQGSQTAISITGLTANSPISSVYWKSGNTGTAPGTFAFSNGNQTVTFTLTANPSPSGGVKTGSSASFTFTPLASITDTDGTAASGSYTTTIQLF